MFLMYGTHEKRTVYMLLYSYILCDIYPAIMQTAQANVCILYTQRATCMVMLQMRSK